MATNLSGSIRAQISMKYNSGNTALTNDQFQAIEAFSTNFTNGTGSGQADLLLAQTISLSSSGTQTFDLDAGTLLDPAGNALTFVKIKAIIVAHSSSSAASAISIGGDFSSTAGIGTNALVAGGSNLIADPTGYTVTATSADVLTVVNADASNTATFDIFLIGTSA